MLSRTRLASPAQKLPSRPAASLRFALVLVVLVALPQAAAALTPISSADISLDVTTELDAMTFDDEDVAIDDLVAATPATLGPLPAALDVDGYHLQGSGNQLLSFDTTVELPRPVTVSPADVVSYDGLGYTIVFDGSAEGVPAGVPIDAVTEQPDLVLSFDTTVALSGTTFDDEDALEFDGVTWEVAYDGSVEHAGLPAADLDAISFVPEPGQLVSLAFGMCFLVAARHRRARSR